MQSLMTRFQQQAPLGDAVETFVRCEDAERFIEEVHGDDPEVAAKLRIEERELEAGGLNQGGSAGTNDRPEVREPSSRWALGRF
jgi:hypothetical protein